MKKFLKFLPLFLIGVLGVTMISCDDDKEETIKVDQLPSTSREFITQYFPSYSIISTRKDKNEYELMLSDGTRIDFYKSGEWQDVDAPVGKTVPSGFYPTDIDTYIAANYSGAGINEISKDNGKLDVELTNNVDLYFSTEGVFLGIDRD